MLCQFVRVRSACETFWLMHARTHARICLSIYRAAPPPRDHIYILKKASEKRQYCTRELYVYMRCINIEMGNLLARAIMLLVCVSMYTYMCEIKSLSRLSFNLNLI